MPQAATQSVAQAVAPQTTGAEFTRFYNDTTVWENDAFTEGVILRINGKLRDGEQGEIDYDNLGAADEIIIEEGGILDGEGRDEDLTAAFSRWRLAQTHVTVAVTVPKAQEAALRQFLTTIGATAN